MVSLIRCEDVSRAHEEMWALQGIDLDIATGDYLAITGASGSGKSSLLHILGLLDQADRGRCLFHGETVAGLGADQRARLRNRSIGFIFQSFHLLPRATAAENVALPLHYAGIKAVARRERAMQALEQVGLAHRAEHRPGQLSGGEQQRVAIARAIIREPELILADEPTGSLDSETGLDIIERLEALNKAGSTLVIVTHDQALATRAQRRLVLEDGRIRSPVSSQRTAAPVIDADRPGPATHRRMTFADHVKSAMGAIASAPLRSGLTALGIVIGVAAVLVQIAIGAGADRVISRQLEALGTRLVMVQAGSSTHEGVRLGAGSRPTLQATDAAAITAAVVGVEATAAAVSKTAQLVDAGRNWSTIVGGSTPNYLGIRDWTVDGGRGFTHEENHTAAKVALVGKTIIRQLHAGADPIGRVIRIDNVPVTVIGTLAARGFNPVAGRDQDDIVIVPLRTAQLRLLGREGPARNAVDFLLLKTAPGESFESLEHDIREALRREHRLPATAPDDFTLHDPAAATEAQQETARSLSWLLAVIASVSMVVGGVGIMNIMLVSVIERTREIGVRMAVGARPRDIEWQFLVEALTLCLAGGIGGIVIGTLVALGIGVFVGWAVVITPAAMAGSILFAAVVGIVFGFYPARRAGRLEPVRALRHE